MSCKSRKRSWKLEKMWKISSSLKLKIILILFSFALFFNRNCSSRAIKSAKSWVRMRLKVPTTLEEESSRSWRDSKRKRVEKQSDDACILLLLTVAIMSSLKTRLKKAVKRFVSILYIFRSTIFTNTLSFSSQSSFDAYIASGIYDKFGNSCTASLATTTKQQEAEAEDLSTSSWFQSGIIGKFSEEILERQTPGTFIIHRVSQKSGNFVLSLRAPSQTSSKVVHFMIVQSKQGYRLKGAAKYFNTVTSLVTHHSVLAEQLPVTLALQRPYEITRKSRDEELNDGDYSIDDLGAIFTDLEC